MGSIEHSSNPTSLEDMEQGSTEETVNTEQQIEQQTEQLEEVKKESSTDSAVEESKTENNG